MKRVLIAILCLACAVPAAPVLAQSLAPGGWTLNQQRDGGRRISPDQAAEIARRQTGGRVLSVRESRDGYQVKVLTPNGEVRHVFVAASGR